MKDNQDLAYLKRVEAEFNIDEFLVMIGREELLTQEEEQQLIVQAQQGDDEAMQRLLSSNMRFVVSLANQYKRDGFTLQKLIQVGVMGLEQAIKTYDLASEQKLIRVAVPIMRECIGEFVNNTHTNTF